MSGVFRLWVFIYLNWNTFHFFKIFQDANKSLRNELRKFENWCKNILSFLEKIVFCISPFFHLYKISLMSLFNSYIVYWDIISNSVGDQMRMNQMLYSVCWMTKLEFKSFNDFNLSTCVNPHYWPITSKKNPS